MSRRKNPRYNSVDYGRRQNERRKMGNYLRTGSFKKIAGQPIYGISVSKRRSLVILAAVAVAVAGFYFVVF